MMALLRRIFQRSPTYPIPENYYERLHEANVNARAQLEAAQRSTRRLREAASRDFADTLAVPPFWHREGGRDDSR